MSNIFTMTTVLAVLVVAVLLPECSGVAVIDKACPNGDSDCTAVDANSECVNAKCACVAYYRQNPDDDTECVAVLGSTCTQTTDCSATVTHSQCTGATGSMTCTCDDGYKTDTNMCTKVLGLRCGNDETCTNLLNGTKCGSNKCKCINEYTEEDDICKTALEQACVTDTTVCVSNAGCVDDKCACNDDYTELDGLCDSAQSVGISAGVLLMSMLVMAIQKLC